MPRSGTKLPKSEATRLKLIDCAVAEIVESGADRLGFTAIARRSSMSTGALYARYENADELLLEVWLNRGLPILRDLLGDLVEALDKDSGVAARLRISERLSAPDRDLLLLDNLLIVGRRNETVAEVLAPSFVDAVSKAMDRAPGLELFLGLALGVPLGVAGTGFTGLDWSGSVSIVARATAAVAESGPVVPDVEPEPETFFSPEGVDDVERRLFDAVAQVIAKVGVDRATVSRIARTADINPASIYMRYEDKNALFRSAISHVMAMGSPHNRRLVEGYRTGTRATGSAVDGAVAMFLGNASKAYEPVRRLRLETMLAATQDEELRRVTNTTFLEAITETEANVGAARGSLTGRDGLPYITNHRFAFFGYAILCEYGLIDDRNSSVTPYMARLGEIMSDLYAKSPSVMRRAH